MCGYWKCEKMQIYIIIYIYITIQPQIRSRSKHCRVFYNISYLFLYTNTLRAFEVSRRYLKFFDFATLWEVVEQPLSVLLKTSTVNILFDRRFALVHLTGDGEWKSEQFLLRLIKYTFDCHPLGLVKFPTCMCAHIGRVNTINRVNKLTLSVCGLVAAGGIGTSACCHQHSCDCSFAYGFVNDEFFVSFLLFLFVR